MDIKRQNDMNTPKFKKGDWIKRKKDGRIARVVMLLKTCYDLILTDGDGWWLDYDFQDNWELTDAPPKNKLDEAARLYAIPHYMKDIDVNHIEEYPYDTGLEAAFIAGAEWMAAQGVNHKLEVKADAGGYPYIDKTFELYDYAEEKPIFNPRDIVIVNIRKK